ncbi:MAG TPA: hypothetical protein VGS21_11060 [Acidimicrobiales bacterium]|nr:hypothetical protein [Acidimicrobiales bacterium]
MSTANGSSTTAPDPKMITDHLLQEIHELLDDSELYDEEPTEDELWAEVQLSGLPIVFSPTTAAAVDAVLPPRSLTAEGRRDALAVVERELASRRRMRGQLPVLLRAVREQRAQSLQSLADQAGLDEKALHGLERGVVGIRRATPETIANWIRPLDPPRDLVVAALRRSLRVTSEQPMLAAGAGDLPPTDDDYVAAVLDLLGWTDPEGDR